MVVRIRVYALTELGKKIALTKNGDDEEIRVLQFLKENRTGTDDELSVAGGERYTIRQLKERGLIKELTS